LLRLFASFILKDISAASNILVQMDSWCRSY